MKASAQRVEEFLFAAVSASPTGILAVDASGAITFANPEIERIFGYPADQLIGAPVEKLLPERARTAHEGYRRSFLAAHQVRRLGAGRDLVGRHRDGREIPIEIALTPIAGPEGAIVLASIIDITERKQAEERLRASESPYRTILEHVADAVFVTDATGRYVDVNPSACAMTGYTREELLQRSVSDTYVPDERDIAAARVAQTAAGRAITFRRRLLRKDGSIILVEGSPVRLPDGRLLATFRDVTDQKRVEDQIRESERLFRELAENVREVFLVVDPGTGRALYVNPAYETVFGHSRQHAYETPYVWIEGIHPEDREAVRAAERRAAESEEFTSITYRIVRPDRSIRWVRGRTTPVRDAAGRVVRLVGIAEDITELKRTEAQLLQAQKMEAVGRLAGGIAHDFNNLLTVITAYGELQLGDLSPVDPRRADLEQILQAARHAANLTRQLLAFSRRQVLELKVVKVNQVVAGIEKMLKRVIGEDIQLVAALDPAAGAVRADPGQLEQVLMNLAVNARDAMPEGGSLTIETAGVRLDEAYAGAHEPIPAGDYVMIAVSDSGSGMDEATKARIFEPFFTTKSQGKGTGLGLATVYGIVKQSGGFIWVYSEPGHGTTFKIYLPRVDEPVATRGPTEAPRTPRHGTETIAVVEDDAAVRRVVREVLRQWGYTILEADRPSTALALADTARAAPDLLITDVVLPEMNGRELAGRLESRWPGLKVLYLSGYADEAIVHHGVLAARVSFLQKPFTPDTLARKVRQVLDG